MSDLFAQTHFLGEDSPGSNSGLPPTSSLSFLVASSAAQRAREVERLRTQTASGSRVVVVPGILTIPVADPDLGIELDSIWRYWLDSYPQFKPLAKALVRLDTALTQMVETDEGLMAPEAVVSRLSAKVRAAQARRDDLQEELTELEHELRARVAQSAETRLADERQRRDQLAESLHHARDCNRRRLDLANRLASLRANVPMGVTVNDLSREVENYTRGVSQLQQAKDAVSGQEALAPLSRSPDWVVGSSVDDFNPTILDLTSLSNELDALAGVAAQVQADMDAISGPPLPESHLEELAQQLASQPAAGLEALERSQPAEEPTSDLLGEEQRLRWEVDRYNLMLALAVGAAVMGAAGGIVLLLGGNMELGLALSLIGPVAGLSWAGFIVSQTGKAKARISEIVRKRVADSQRVAKPAGAVESTPAGEISKLPAVAERVRALQAGKKETAKKRLQVRSDHASWTKKVLGLPEFVRKRLPAIPDPFAVDALQNWRRICTEVRDVLETEVVRRDRLACLASTRQQLDQAMSLFASSRKALTDHLGADAFSLSNEELIERAQSLAGDCAQILAVESALNLAVEIPEQPLQERLQAVEARISGLEKDRELSGQPVDAVLDAERLAPEDRQRMDAARRAVQDAEKSLSESRRLQDEFTTQWEIRRSAAGLLRGELDRRVQEFGNQIRTVFSGLCRRFMLGVSPGIDDGVTVTLNDHLELSGTVADHFRSALELCRSVAILVQGPRPIRLVVPEPLADSDNPTYLAWISAVLEQAPDLEISAISILTCQQWRLDALRSLRPELFVHVPVRNLDE